MKNKKNLPKLDTTVLENNEMAWWRKLYVVRRNMVAWKKVAKDKVCDDLPSCGYESQIIKLIIPKGAIVVCASKNEKARADVVIPQGSGFSVGFSGHPKHRNFPYRKGKRTKCEKKFTTNTANDCGSGIHFFWSKKEAERYC